MGEIKEFLSGPARELECDPTFRRAGWLLAQNATNPTLIRQLISVWKCVDRSPLIVEGAEPSQALDDLLIGIAEGTVVLKSECTDVDEMFPMLPAVRRISFVDSDWLGRVLGELERFADAMFVKGPAETPLVRAARIAAKSLASNSLLTAAIIEILDHVFHRIAPESLEIFRSMICQEPDFLNQCAKHIAEMNGFAGLVGAAKMHPGYLIPKPDVPEDPGLLIDLSKYHHISLSEEARDGLYGWVRRGGLDSGVDIDDAFQSAVAGSRYERLVLLREMLTTDAFEKVGLTESQVTQHFLEIEGRCWFSAADLSQDWLFDVCDRKQVPLPCIGFVWANGSIDWDGVVDYRNLERSESTALRNAALGMLANGFASVADALSAVHFLIAMLSWRHTIPNFKFFSDILRNWPNSVPLLVELVQASATIENVLGYAKARQCASLRSLTPVREGGQKVVRLVIHERSNDRHNAAEFDFTGFSDGLSMRIREYLELIPRSSPRNRPSSSQCEDLIQRLGKVLEGVLREYYVPFIKSNEVRLRELDITFRDHWEKSSKFIVFCIDRARGASSADGTTSQLNCGITAEDIDLLYEVIKLRNKASHVGEAKEAIRWRDVVKMEEILLDSDLLRRLVTCRSSSAPEKS